MFINFESPKISEARKNCVYQHYYAIYYMQRNMGTGRTEIATLYKEKTRQMLKAERFTFRKEATTRVSTPTCYYIARS